MNVPVPKVTMNGSIPKKRTIPPLIPPITAPAPSATSIARPIGQWWTALSCAMIIADNVSTDAIERS